MNWNVEHTSEFGDWWSVLTERQQEDISAVVLLLMEQWTATAIPLFVRGIRIAGMATCGN